MTMEITDELRSYLEKTLVWLEAGAPHETDTTDEKLWFDMNTWKYSSDVVNSDDLTPGISKHELEEYDNFCGTVLCMGGYVEQLSNGKFHKHTDQILMLGELFYPFHLAYDADLSKENCAKVLHHFLETGEIKWKQ